MYDGDDNDDDDDDNNDDRVCELGMDPSASRLNLAKVYYEYDKKRNL
jgi:hypothetical protein